MSRGAGSGAAWTLAAGLVLSGLWACTASREGAGSAGVSPAPLGEIFDWRLPPGFPRPLVPADNPMSAAKVELGRYLFYDRRLSATGTFACASCHRQELAFTDGRPRALGATGELHPRGAMSLAGVAYNPIFAWADPTLESLEDQALVPMFNRDPVELGVEGDGSAMVERLAADRRYRQMFTAAFPATGAPAAGAPAAGTPAAGDRISVATVVKALAAFERTLISGRSAYDRRVYSDERSAMTEPARRGTRLFFSDDLGCFRCHGGVNFSGPVVHAGAPRRRFELHNTGLYNFGERGFYPPDNRGLREHTGKKRDDGRFRAPTLRNVALTAPYMHDGSIATLGEVVDHYAAGGRTLASGPYAGVGGDNPRKSPLVTGFDVTATQKADLVAFLESLTDTAFVTDPRFGDPWVNSPGSRPRTAP